MPWQGVCLPDETPATISFAVMCFSYVPQINEALEHVQAKFTIFSVCLLKLLPTTEEESFKKRGTEEENCVVPCRYTPPIVVGLCGESESMGINDPNCDTFARVYQPELSG